MITIEEFGNLDLRVGRIAEAHRLAGTENLVQLEVDLGDEKRTTVAGIAKYYQPEVLVGKQVVMVANMKPTVIRGIQSNGMILAAGPAPPKGYVLVTVDGEVPNGTRVS
ncbi:MAG: methionine--tRNA ligase subunit beta [Chloroflexi bacterium]|nr:methionine--tRNA ligase subunit beta [Chloroflexota bacterium]